MNEILIYALGGLFLVTLTWHIIHSRMYHSFRTKTVTLLKKQKSQIEALENSKDALVSEKDGFKTENIKNQQHIDNISKKYLKIEILLKDGLLNIVRNIPKKGTKKEIESGLSEVKEYTSNLILWHEAFFSEAKPDKGPVEITDFINEISAQLTDHFSGSHLNFIHHISEPIEVFVNQLMISYIFHQIGRIMGERSVSGNTIYIDTERTGKKCLITFEDAGPGIDDESLKTILNQINNQVSLSKNHHREVIPLIFIRDFIEWHDGKLWLSTIQEIGIKFTFSLPLNI